MDIKINIKQNNNNDNINIWALIIATIQIKFEVDKSKYDEY